MIIKNQKKILSLILIAIFAFFGILIYFYYLGNKPIENQSLVSGTSAVALAGDELNIPESGKDFLKTLKTLKKIKIDTEFFNQEVFKGLIDFSQELPFEEKGRLNPFAPLGK